MGRVDKGPVGISWLTIRGDPKKSAWAGRRNESMYDLGDISTSTPASAFGFIVGMLTARSWPRNPIGSPFPMLGPLESGFGGVGRISDCDEAKNRSVLLPLLRAGETAPSSRGVERATSHSRAESSPSGVPFFFGVGKGVGFFSHGGSEPYAAEEDEIGVLSESSEV